MIIYIYNYIKLYFILLYYIIYIFRKLEKLKYFLKEREYSLTKIRMFFIRVFTRLHTSKIEYYLL